MVLKLGNYVLGTKTKLLTGLIFDLGPRSENMYGNLKIVRDRKILKNGHRQFLNPIFSLLGPKSKKQPGKTFCFSP